MIYHFYHYYDGGGDDGDGVHDDDGVYALDLIIYYIHLFKKFL